MEFLDQIRKELRPDESVLKLAEMVVNKINASLKKKNIRADCVTGGSIAKGTFLRGDFDVDLFVRFDYGYVEENLSDMLEKCIPYKSERVHGSRDYFQFKVNDINFEAVPVLKIDDAKKARNVTDMSPLHVEWVKKNLNPGQDGEIRLAKKFCKAARVYGAESYISGFSGHVLDILVIYYGDFISLLKSSARWKPKVIIDIEKQYKSRMELMFDMNQSKLQSPLIVVDPIMKDRNAASALSYQKFSTFKKKAKEFMKNPSKKFFEEIKIGKTYLKKKFKKNLYIITLKAKDGKRDIVGSKILKSFSFVKSRLKKRGFELKDSGWTWNKKKRVLFWFVFKDDVLPEKKVIEGPPVSMEEHVKRFKKKYKNVEVKDGTLFANVEIKKRDTDSNLIEILKDSYLADKIKFLDIS